MKKNNVLTKAVLMTAGLPAVLLALVLTACSTGSEKEEDPVFVDLTLLSIQEVANYSEPFAADEVAAKLLVKTAFEEIEKILDTSSFQSSSVSSVSQSVSRSVQSAPYEQIFDHDTTVLPGAEVTGFVQGRQTMSAADDTNPGGTVGDYIAESGRTKLAIKFADFRPEQGRGPIITINGKYSRDENTYYKIAFTAANAGDITISYNVLDQYAISISNSGAGGGISSPGGGSGLKFVMKIQGRINKTIPWDESTLESILNNIGALVDPFSLSLDIYNNNNEKEEDYSRVFTSYAEAATELSL